MRILYVIGSQINGFPPARNVLEILLNNGHVVTLIARDNTGLVIKNNKNFKFVRIPEYDTIPAIIRYKKKVHFMRDAVEREMVTNDLLWTATDATVRDLGDIVFKYKHVMQLMELIQDIPKFPGLKHPDLGIKKYARRAFKVVVPEYNRAHIQKTWWDLSSVPVVLPNKMRIPEISINDIPEDLLRIVKKAEKEKRRIILYQGVFYDDRELEPFVDASKALKDNYVLYLMGSETPYKRRLCNMFDGIESIPFIKPPFHLLLTQQAYIGLLPYKPSSYLHYDKINALYCAPNKIFEYAAYGIPMIGTDVPGLHIPFSIYGLGYTCQPYTKEMIINCFNMIEQNYKRISNSCIDYYNSINMDEIIEKQILMLNT